MTVPGSASFSIILDNEKATGRLAADLAVALEPGDVITLSGDLGAGKTTLARALIRQLAGDDSIAVPSPTFTLVQSYDLPRFTVVHADLYRVSDPSELSELGLDDFDESAVVLMEWPDRAAAMLPPDRFDLTLTLEPNLGLEARKVQLTGYGACAFRAERIVAARDFLEASGYARARRLRLQGDASTRSYERLILDRHPAILMNSPRRPDGPPVRDGKAYSAIAHLAEDVKPFVAIAQALRHRGFSTPAIYHADLERGLLIIEDLGQECVVAGDPPAPIPERYAAAVDVLLHLHQQRLPATIRLSGKDDYVIPRYDRAAFQIEVELLLDWYIPRAGGQTTAAMRDDFIMAWEEALIPVLMSETTWTQRDFHSPNLLWLPEREGIARVGLLDFQDTVIGPPAYDLVSLLQDARVDVSEPLELKLLAQYVAGRRAQDKNFDAATFGKLYATIGAQRASKILGIFARLEKRDGKPQYLRHIPRVWGYLQRSLAHPGLARLADWYKNHVPEFPAASSERSTR